MEPSNTTTGSGVSSGDILQLANMAVQGTMNSIAQARNLKNIQKQSARDAAQVMRQARQQVSSFLDQERQVAATRRAAFGAAGVSRMGSPMVVADEAADVASETVGRVMEAAARQANALRRQRRKAKDAQRINQISGAGKMLAGIVAAPFTGGASLLIAVEGQNQLLANTNT